MRCRTRHRGAAEVPNMTTTRTETSTADMDAAAFEALEKLRELEDDDKLKPGLEAVRKWWQANYLKAGHKRLAKALLGKLK